MSGRSHWYTREEVPEGAGPEMVEAAAALKALRASSRKEARPFRAASLAEAELTGTPKEGVVSEAMLREHGLVGKHKRVSRGASARVAKNCE